jgi:hypothetical protein
MNKVASLRAALQDARRIRITITHLILSLVVNSVLAAFVVIFWYPPPFLSSSGGLELLIQVFSIDMVLGSFLVCLVSNGKKKKSELIRDLMVIISLQIAALLYGAYVVLLARPVFLVFEYDRFRVVHMVDITESLWAKSDEEKKHSLWSPMEIRALREFKSDSERSDATIMAINGYPLAFQTQLWSKYGPEVKGLNKTVRPAEHFANRYPQWSESVLTNIRKVDANAALGDFVYTTMMDKNNFWTVFLDRSTLQPKFYLPVDSF